MFLLYKSIIFSCQHLFKIVFYLLLFKNLLFLYAKVYSRGYLS